MNLLFKLTGGLRTLLKNIGGFCLIGMTLLTCADVVGRYLGHPIFGSVEIVGFLATLIAALAMPYTHQARGHAGVEILFRLLSERTQTVIELFTHAVSLLLFAVVTWRMIYYAGTISRSGEVSMSIEFPLHVIIYITAFCFLVLTLTILEDIVNTTKRLMGRT
ncbi:MAG: TRAP transporter small permease [Desulfosarcina sp.]